MKIAITGATGNVGTSLLETLAREPQVHEIVGIARRSPSQAFPKTRFVQADVSSDDLYPHFCGVDAVVHLAWALQPSRDRERLHQTNVVGSHRVFCAALSAQVPTLIHASSFAAYTPGPLGRDIDERWPLGGFESSTYALQKVAVERLLDEIEREHPSLRVVRMRPTTILKRSAGSELSRRYWGRLFPKRLLERVLPFVPDFDSLRIQAVHADDVAQAFRAALLSDVQGAFNLTASQPLDADHLAKLLAAPKAFLPPPLLRALVALSYRLRLHPTDPSWLDIALASPLLSNRRANRRLGWRPRYSAEQTLADAIEGLRRDEGYPTPPLAPI